MLVYAGFIYVVNILPFVLLLINHFGKVSLKEEVWSEGSEGKNGMQSANTTQV